MGPLLLESLEMFIIALLAPAVYAGVLAAFTEFFGESAYIHVAVFIAFLNLFLSPTFAFIKNKLHPEEKEHGTENQDNEW